MTPIVSSMIAPAEIPIAKDLNITGGQLQSQLIFSIFLLAFVIAPFVLAPLSEIFGRMIVLQMSNMYGYLSDAVCFRIRRYADLWYYSWFLIFNLVCGFAQNESQMLAFRFLAGLGASAPQTIGGGVLSDLWKPEQRGLAVSIYTLAPLLGPALGPLMGAWIAERTTWRWLVHPRK
jgi:MFS family permease